MRRLSIRDELLLALLREHKRVAEEPPDTRPTYHDLDAVRNQRRQREEWALGPQYRPTAWLGRGQSGAVMANRWIARLEEDGLVETARVCGGRITHAKLTRAGFREASRLAGEPASTGEPTPAAERAPAPANDNRTPPRGRKAAALARLLAQVNDLTAAKVDGLLVEVDRLGERAADVLDKLATNPTPELRTAARRLSREIAGLLGEMDNPHLGGAG